MANKYYKIQFNVYINILEVYAGRITVPPALVESKLRDMYPYLSDPKNALSNQNESVTEAAKDQ